MAVYDALLSWPNNSRARRSRCDFHKIRLGRHRRWRRQLAVLWNQVADRKAAKEALLPPQDQTHNSPPVDESGAHTGN
jgi:hypothetical protein